MKIFQSYQNFLTEQLSKTSKFDGRFLLLVILILYFLPILFTSKFFTYYPDSWSDSYLIYPLVSKMLPPFADMRVITAGAECIRLGYDVLIKNPCDPWHRPMNYPQIWAILANWGLNQSHTVALGILCGLLFFALTFVTIKRLNYVESLLYALVLCSPSVMLTVERGNNDLIIFIILALSLLAIKGRNLIQRSLGYILILFAAILKLYPIFALISCLKEKRRNFFLIFLALVISFGIYVIGNLESLYLVSKATPRSTFLAYGIKVLFNVFLLELSNFSIIVFKQGFIKFFQIVMLIIFNITIFIVILKAYDLAKNEEEFHQQESEWETNQIDVFRIGASIYLGSYLIGNNWDYRLIFLLFTIPQILAWIKSRNCFAKISGLALVGIILTTWISYDTYRFFYLDEIINWLLFLFYVYTLILTLPKWLKSYMYLQPRDLEASS
ncbi:hypothetical protein [Floridanema evergladense]|uniref:DUF2029 domain-containing protein n=1 Tax=Floridaenema evergladense BLCC-F167 TaxID=3153639 RepID=A0ABV4WV23_9CYAN